MLHTEVPYTLYFDKSGAPLDGGSIYFGTANGNPETSPTPVFWDAAGTQPVAQPVKTVAGYPVRSGTIADVYCATDYAVTVRDKVGGLVRYAPTSASFSVASQLAALSTSLAGSAGSSLVGFTQAGTLPAPRTAQDKLRERVTLNDFIGYDPTGATDSTTALVNACASLGTAGGVIEWTGVCLIDQNFTLPDNVFLVGKALNVGQRLDGAYVPSNFVSALIINSTKTITHGSRCGVRNCLVLCKVLSPLGAFPMPFANATVATNAVAAFAGTAFTPAATTQDFRLEDVLVLGFQYLYAGSGATSNNRPIFRRVYGDCTNGIQVANVFDIGRAEDCHMWPFTTTNQTFTTDALLLRTGTAFYTGAGSTWMKWQDCFEYGYAVGHDVNSCQDVRQVNCGADSTANIAQTCIGFQYRGSMANVSNINPTATAQGNTGFLVNTTAQNSVNDIKIVAPVCHGNNSANGYVHIQSGNYSISDAQFIDNNSVGHIKLDSTAGSGSVVSPTFANNGSTQPIFGDAGAISRCQLTNPMYQGTFTKQPFSAWTPVLKFGGATTGITYSVQAGRWKMVDGVVVAEFKITLTSKGSAVGNATIDGLPLTTANITGVAGGASAAPYYLAMAGLTSPPLIAAVENGTFLNLYNGGAAGVVAMADTNFTNTSTIYGHVTYIPG